MTLAALVAVVGTAPAHGKSMVKESIGCFERATFERLDRLLYGMGGDAGPFKSAANEMVRTAECLPMPRGKIVTIDDVESRLMCVRLDARLPCLWTWRDTVGD